MKNGANFTYLDEDGRTAMEYDKTGQLTIYEI
jgi:YD repeat-containing protein